MEQNLTTTESRGGKRSNAGRKPSGIKKEPIFFYIESDIVMKFGKAELRNRIYNYVNQLKNEN